MGASYTKGEINRAGKLARQLVTMPGTTDAAFDALGRDEIFNAFYAITWWRSHHARPLSSVAAGLRYHDAK